MSSRFFFLSTRIFVYAAIVFGCSALSPSRAFAATCSVTSDAVVDQTYIDGGSCTRLEISGGPTTVITWTGNIDMSGPVVIQSGTVVFDGALNLTNPASELLVDGGAVLTHAAEDPRGLSVTAPSATITGSVTADAKGCAGGAPGENGSGPDLDTGICASATSGYGVGSGGNGGGGGANGGAGGTGSGSSPQTAVYASSTAPYLLGSGGGGGWGGAGGSGARGGGRIGFFISGILTVNGTMTANAGSASGIGGGGSGGSVLVKAGTLNGVGTIAASGSNGSAAAADSGGGGGGGGVAVYYTTLGSFTLSNISAAGGLHAAGGGVATDGSGGSTWVLDRFTDDGSGSVYIPSGLRFKAGFDYGRTSFTIGSGASLTCEAQTTLTISTTGNYTDQGSVWTCSQAVNTVSLNVGGTLTTNSIQWDFSNVDSVQLIAGAWVNSGTQSLSITKAGSSASFDVGGSLTLNGLTYTGAAPGSASANGGVLTILDTGALSLVGTTISANLFADSLASFSLDADSSLSANGKGCEAGASGGGDGFGPDLSTGVCTVTTSGYGIGSPGGGGGGAAHGGAGGTGTPSSPQVTVYGSSTAPTLFGSGGGSGWSGAGGTGGAGGGKIYIKASGGAVINGPISANGVNGTGIGGGGSGGSVFLRADGTLSGVGTIAANGGNGSAAAADHGGGGGGGRIAVLYGNLGSFSLSGASVTSTGGTDSGGGSEAGGSGSVYTLLLNQSPNLPTSLGQASLVDGSTTGTNNPILAFNITDPDASDTVRYHIQIDDAPSFGSPVIDYTSGLGSQGARSFQIGQVVGSGSYAVGSSGQVLDDGSWYWRVQTIDQNSVASSYVTARSGSVAFSVDAVTRLLSIETDSYLGAESVLTPTIRVMLNTTHFEDVSVHYAVSGGTAEGSGGDYTLTSGTATISAGDLYTTLPLTVVNDSITEPSETIRITLSSPQYAIIGSNTSTVYTITDNDTAAVTLSRTSLPLTEGGDTDGYTVVLETAPTTTVQVVLSPASGLSLSAGTLSFSALNWNTPQTVIVRAVNDSQYLGNRSLSIAQTVSSSAYGYSSLALSSVVINVTDDDAPGGGATSASGSSAGGLAVFVPMVVGAPPASSPPIVGIPGPSANPLPIVHEPISTPPISSAHSSTEAFDTLSAEMGAVVVADPDDIEQVVERFADGKRDTVREAQMRNFLAQDVGSFGVAKPSTEAEDRLVAFLSYGLTAESAKLGTGERRAIFRDAVETMRTANMPITDLVRMAHGQIPKTRNLPEEQKRASRVLATFKTVFKHAPRFQDAEENLAWNTLMYRMRFPRDLVKEADGVRAFRATFKKSPKDPFQWSVVRVMGYVIANE